MAGQLDGTTDQIDGGVTIAQASEALGLSERTIRRRIKAGTLAAYQVPTAQGYEWRVRLDGATRQPDTATSQASRQGAGQVDSRLDTAALTQALALVEKQEQTIMELAGRCGYLQAQLQQRDEQIRMLTAPKEPEPEPQRPQPSFWRRWLGLQPA